MRIRLLFVGRTVRGPVADLLADYVDRTQRMAAVEIVIIPEAAGADPARQQQVESKRCLDALLPGERVVVLDERGAAMASTAFAVRLGTWRDQGVRQVAFVVGGAYGHTEELRQRADLILALSAMTLPHQLVRVVLAEQVYRAFSILNRSPYHH